MSNLIKKVKRIRKEVPDDGDDSEFIPEELLKALTKLQDLLGKKQIKALKLQNRLKPHISSTKTDSP